MNEDNGMFATLLILLIGGAAAWYFWTKKQAPVAPPAQAPCNVGASYAGVGASIPCTYLDKGIKAAEAVVTGIGKAPAAVTSGIAAGAVSLLGGGGGAPCDLATATKFCNQANARGVIFSATSVLQGAPKPLPPGYANVPIQSASGEWTIALGPASPVGAPPAIFDYAVPAAGKV